MRKLSLGIELLLTFILSTAVSHAGISSGRPYCGRAGDAFACATHKTRCSCPRRSGCKATNFADR